MIAARNGHALVQRLEFPPMPELPARAAGSPMQCVCGETVTPQRAGDSWVFYCWRSGHGWSEPAPRRCFQRQARVAVKRCQCSSRCRFCGGAR